MFNTKNHFKIPLEQLSYLSFNSSDCQPNSKQTFRTSFPLPSVKLTHAGRYSKMSALLLSLALSIILLASRSTAAIGPPSCEGFYGCISSLRQSDCGQGEVLISGALLNGCCPGCRGGQGHMKVCNVNVANRRCAPGLKCADRKCIYDRCKYLSC